MGESTSGLFYMRYAHRDRISIGRYSEEVHRVCTVHTKGTQLVRERVVGGGCSLHRVTLSLPWCAKERGGGRENGQRTDRRTG